MSCHLIDSFRQGHGSAASACGPGLHRPACSLHRKLRLILRKRPVAGAASKSEKRLKLCTPLDLVSIGDVNGNGAAELVMRGRCGTAAQLRAFVVDAKLGASLHRLDFCTDRVVINSKS